MVIVEEEHGEGDNDFVNGWVVGIPERVIVKEDVTVLVILTDFVKLPEGVLVVKSEGLTVTGAVGVIVIEGDLDIVRLTVLVTVGDTDLVFS